MDFIGKQINSYRIVAEIDSGSYGRVYRAEHTLLPRPTVAVKLLHLYYSSQEGEPEKFIQEARILEKVRHQYILPVIDVGFYEDLPFIISRFAPGGSLRARLKKQSGKPLPFHETMKVLTQVGQALEHIHQQKVIHCDLKPENILFDEQGDVLLSDFGISRVVNTSSSMRTSNPRGTCVYMAPEQFFGAISKEGDQYSLGCLAYELFTGRKVFENGPWDVLSGKHATEAPVPPRDLNPLIPKQIESAILRALAKKAPDRFPGVSAFIEALNAQVEEEQSLLPTMPSIVIPLENQSVPPVSSVKQLDPQHIKQASEWHIKGNSLYKQKKYQEALAAFEKAVQLDPANSEYQGSLGRGLYGLERFEDALLAFEKAVRLDPKKPYNVKMKAEILHILKRYQEALEGFRSAAVLDPSMAYYLKKQGEILFELKQFEEALKIFEMAIPREPENLSLVKWREKSQEQIKLQSVSPQKSSTPDPSTNKQTPVPSQPKAQEPKPEQAQPKAQEKKSAQAQPKAQEPKPIQAQPKAQEKKSEQAQPKAQEKKPEQAQSKAQEKKPAPPKPQEPKLAQAQPKAQEKKTKSEKLSLDKATKAAFDHYLQGNMLYNDRKYQDALMAYDIALHLDPKNAEYFCGRGRAFAALNLHEKALLAFSEAVQQKPNTPDYLRLKGEAFYALGRYEKSLNAFRAAADLSPNVASYHEMQGEIYCKLGRLDLALRAFKRAIKLEPDNPNYLARQKQIQAKLNPKGNVQSSLAASVFQARKVSLDTYNQGMSLYQQKNYQQALKAFDNAVRLESLNPTYHYARGLALTQLRRYSDALLAFDEAIRLHPNFREALSQKAEVLKAMGRNIEAEQTMIINRKQNVDRNNVTGQNNDNPDQENLFQKFLKRLFD